MKKILLLSAFAFFGSFTMANDKLETKEEIKIETVVEVYGCTVSIVTVTYNSCGEKVGSHTDTYWSDSPKCEGLEIYVHRVNSPAPCQKEPVSVVEEGEQ